MRKAILYIHGKGGSASEADNYRKNCDGYDVIGIEYELNYPWLLQDTLQEAYRNIAKKYDSISLIATSIGAYYSMNSLKDVPIEKALFISPLLDMEQLICNMINWANVTEKELEEKKKIETDFGEALSWEYLCYVRNNPIQWNVPTEILYASRDNLTSRDTADSFVKKHNAHLTIMENGEHWFHTNEQIAFLNAWMKAALDN